MCVEKYVLENPAATTAFGGCSENLGDGSDAVLGGLGSMLLSGNIGDEVHPPHQSRCVLLGQLYRLPRYEQESNAFRAWPPS